MDMEFHVFVIFALGGGKWSLNAMITSYSGLRLPSIHRTAGRVDPRSGLNTSQREEFLACQELNHNASVIQLTA
jgi:hypothetical protein